MVDKYDVQKSCLSFVEINLYFGLGDVWRITSLLIDGKVIVVKDVNRRALCEEFAHYVRSFLAWIHVSVITQVGFHLFVLGYTLII